MILDSFLLFNQSFYLLFCYLALVNVSVSSSSVSILLRLRALIYSGPLSTTIITLFCYYESQLHFPFHEKKYHDLPSYF